LLARLVVDGRRVAELHRELLPEDVQFGAEGFGARIEPYRSTIGVGEVLELDVTVRNPFDRPAVAVVRLAIPERWSATPDVHEVELPEHREATVRFRLVAGSKLARARIGADLTDDGSPFGQQAEALVTAE
jgi:hypothetical protein